MNIEFLIDYEQSELDKHIHYFKLLETNKFDKEDIFPCAL